MPSLIEIGNEREGRWVPQMIIMEAIDSGTGFHLALTDISSSVALYVW